MKRILYTTIFFFSFQIEMTAQENDYCKTPDASLFSSVSINGWVNFQQGLKLNAPNLFLSQKKSFLLPDNFEMKKVKSFSDELGFSHTWYSQYVNNIPVLFGHFILHEKNNQLQSGNGKIYTTSNINSSKSISENEAVKKALLLVNAKKYYWQDTAKENRVKRKLNKFSATYYPQAELFYHYDELTAQLRLCYKMAIKAFDPGKSGILYMYADNGYVFLWDPMERSTCDASVVNTVWYGNRTIYCYTDVATSGWDLEDDCTASTFKVYDYATASNSIFNSGNNQWTTPRQRSAATALWCIRQSREVFWNNYSRDGHNANGGNIDMYFDYIFAGNQTSNANYSYDQFGDDEINIGRGAENPSILDDFVALDILAHEFTHGVTQFTAGLLYRRESGALNESFSDIFGEFVENKIFGGNNWLLGWDLTNTNGNHLPQRNLENPNQFDQPDRYLGSKWRDATPGCNPMGPGTPGDNDFCGVHFNSGVQNRMAYLLSVGGSGWTNDSTSHNSTATGSNPYPWAVSGIGIDKAARIAYRVLTSYLNASSNYYDSRSAWVHAAVDIYGPCSFEAIQTGKAWHAVGIYPPLSVSSNFCGTYGNTPITVANVGQINVAQNCTVNILPTGNTVQVTSGTKIVIGSNPGFAVLNGSRFILKINSDCYFSSY